MHLITERDYQSTNIYTQLSKPGEESFTDHSTHSGSLTSLLRMLLLHYIFTYQLVVAA